MLNGHIDPKSLQISIKIQPTVTVTLHYCKIYASSKYATHMPHIQMVYVLVYIPHMNLLQSICHHKLWYSNIPHY